jgi:hypothetical protein
MTTTAIPITRWFSLTRLALPASGAAVVAVVISAALPEKVYYDKGAAPAWVPLLAAALAICAVTLAGRSASRRTVLIAGWAATVLFLWSAGGVVLDGFRAFYWATGIPAGDFAQVDWPGALRRFVSLVAVAAVGAGTLSFQRTTANGCRSCGRPARERPTAWLGYTAFAVNFPYPALKLYWSLGGSIGRPVPYSEGFPAMELAGLVAGALLSLALVQRWGRRLPRRLVLAPALLGTAALISMAALMVFGTTTQLLGITDGPVDFSDTRALLMVGAVYVSWLVFGLALGGSALAYQRDTRPACADCGR